MAIEVRAKKKMESFFLDVSFRSESRRIGILGASGSGKSMTLKSIAGIERLDEGMILADGRVMYDGARKICLTPQQRRVGYLFQNYALFPTMTVEKNIGIGLNCGKQEKKNRVCEIMERFGILELAGRLPAELSGGQQQRAALARILVYEPEMILLDEPFSALDVYLKDKLQRECMELLSDYPGTVILVSHSRDEIFRFSEEAMVIDGGRIIGQKPVRALFEEPERVETARLTGCKNIAGIVHCPDGIYIPEWDMMLKDGDFPSDISHVGIRAHEFEICAEEKKDYYVFPVAKAKVTEDLFEYNIAFRTTGNAKKCIDWKVSKYQWDVEKNGIPGKLYLAKERMLKLH